MPDIGGIPYVESSDLVSGWPTVSQSVAQEVSDQLASKLPYSYGTATPTTSDSGFLWYDSNSTPAAPKFWDGAAFQALTSGKILQIVRATDSTTRTTSSTSYVDASLSVTITPQKNDSAVLLIWSAVHYFDGTNQFMETRITDSSNNPINGAERCTHGLGTGVNLKSPNVLIGYATPATTSATTYKAQFKIVNASYFAVLLNAEATGQLYAIEVSA